MGHESRGLLDKHGQALGSGVKELQRVPNGQPIGDV
jgi:hypothetical protein